MAAGLSVTYEQMVEACKKANATADDMERMMGEMNSYIGFLCDNWEADASQAYRDDYAAIAGSVVRTSETVKELTASVEQYMKDLQELDRARAGSKVSVG